MERARMSIDGWMDKENVVCVCVCVCVCVSAIEKNEILPLATVLMKVDCIMLSKKGLSEEDKFHVISLMSGI